MIARLARAFLGASLVSLCAVGVARADTVCTLVARVESGAILHEAGDCDTRVTPASTFKVALAVMGFDSGVLVDPHTPTLPFKEGYPDWLGDAWRQDTDPARWIEHSVVWYSQRITEALGARTLTDYATAFGYGNADFSGDPGADNGLERAWISSSLKISPREQAAFFVNFLTRRLPVSPAALENTARIVQSVETADGWTVFGKTGSAYPRRADMSFDRERGWGWFVGWAVRGEDRLVFVRLDQDTGPVSGSPGLRARAAFIEDWPTLAAAL